MFPQAISESAQEKSAIFSDNIKELKMRMKRGVLTGKSVCYGGSLARTEATGYGLLFYMREMLKHHDITLQNKIVTVSGSGNVAIYAVEKAQNFGAKVVAMSDSNGCIYDENGIDLACIKEIKEVRRGRIKEYLNTHPKAKYFENNNDGVSPIWRIKTDIALPCATQNELSLEAKYLLITVL